MIRGSATQQHSPTPESHLLPLTCSSLFNMALERQRFNLNNNFIYQNVYI